MLAVHLRNITCWLASTELHFGRLRQPRTRGMALGAEDAFSNKFRKRNRGKNIFTPGSLSLGSFSKTLGPAKMLSDY